MLVVIAPFFGLNHVKGTKSLNYVRSKNKFVHIGSTITMLAKVQMLRWVHSWLWHLACPYSHPFIQGPYPTHNILYEICIRKITCALQIVISFSNLEWTIINCKVSPWFSSGRFLVVRPHLDFHAIIFHPFLLCRGGITHVYTLVSFQHSFISF